MVKPTLASLLALSGLASAQKQGMWGQCGGNGWSGPFDCVEGATCQFVNDWYSQCLPGTAPTTTKTTSSSTSTKTSTSTSTTTTKPPPASTGFPSVSGTRFNIDGETKYVAGTNCYWCSFLTHTPDVDLVFDHLVSSGLKVLRIWGFNDVNSDPGSGTVWFQLLSSSGSRINTGANGLQRLDYAVRAAEERGLKLIINFVNYWDDYGGMKAYANAFGGSPATWYTNSAAQAQYRKYIEAVVARYKDSSAILAWELANEPRCPGCDTSVIYNWAKETSEFVKRLDPNHLVTLGDEGFGIPGDSSYPYGYSEGIDWVKNLDISTLDFATIHMYPSHWGTSWDWGNKWIADHAAICAQKNKPCFLEEYGSTPEHCAIESEWQATSLAADGMAGDAFWQFGDVTSGGRAHDDGFTIYYGTDEWKCLVTDHVANINSDEC